VAVGEGVRLAIQEKGRDSRGRYAGETKWSGKPEREQADDRGAWGQHFPRRRKNTDNQDLVVIGKNSPRTRSAY